MCAASGHVCPRRVIIGHSWALSMPALTCAAGQVHHMTVSSAGQWKNCKTSRFFLTQLRNNQALTESGLPRKPYLDLHESCGTPGPISPRPGVAEPQRTGVKLDRVLAVHWQSEGRAYPRIPQRFVASHAVDCRAPALIPGPVQGNPHAAAEVIGDVRLRGVDGILLEVLLPKSSVPGSFRLM